MCVRERERRFFGNWRGKGSTVDEGGQCRVRVMDRLPHLPIATDGIDETLIRVEWPDPTGKCCLLAHPDKLTAKTVYIYIRSSLKGSFINANALGLIFFDTCPFMTLYGLCESIIRKM